MKLRRLMMLVFLMLLCNNIFAQVSPFSTADGWVWRNPLPFEGDFIYTAILDEDTYLISGDYGVIIKSEDGGENWVQCDVPEGVIAPIKKIQFFEDNETGYAVVADRLLRTVNGGVTWSYFNQQGFDENYLVKDVSIIGDDVYMLVANSVEDSSNLVLTKTIDQNRWSRELNGDEDFSGLTNIYYPYIWNRAKIFNLNEMVLGYVVGIKDVMPIPNSDDFLILKHSNIYKNTFEADDRLTVLGGGPQALLAIDESIYYSVGYFIHRTSDGGESFVDLGGVGERFRAVGFHDRNTGIAVGENARVISTINSGNFWLNSIIQSSQVDHIRNVHFLNDTTGFIIQSDVDSSAIFKTEDAGNTWTRFITTVNELYQVSKFHIFPNETRVFVLEGNGTLRRIMFAAVAIAMEIETEVTDFHFLNMDNGWYIKANSIYATLDGGIRWRRTFEFENNIHLNAVFFVNEEVGYVAGNQGTVLKTVDAGRNWEDLSVVGVDINALSFIDENTGFAAADFGVFFKTTDGGVNWVARRTGVEDDLHSLKFWDDQVGYVVTSGGFIATRDAGDSFETFITPLGFDVGYTQKSPSLFVTDATFTNFIYGRGRNVLVGANAIGAGISDDVEHFSPSTHSLLSNYPNPFNSTTIFSINLRKSGKYTFSLYSANGRLVGNTQYGYAVGGVLNIPVVGNDMSTGIYFGLLNFDNEQFISKAVLIR